MKKRFFPFAIAAFSLLTWSCNDNSSTTTAEDSTSNMNASPDSMNNTNATANMNTTPFNSEDSAFVMEAATGGIMDVELGNLAQQYAASQRVKDFGSMMVADHGKANNELKSMVNGRVMIPDSLPAKMKKEMDQLRKLNGKAFDRSYMSLMTEDHKKDIDKFQKQSQSGTDAQLKSWAGATLPVLQKHYDSVQAISKGL
jgi:putative membrane protein